MRTLLGIAIVVLAGCGGPSLNKSQFSRLKLGMTVTEVEGILGKGKAIDSGEVERLVNASQGDSPGQQVKVNTSELRGLRWGNEKKNVTVVFENDRVFRVYQNGLN